MFPKRRPLKMVIDPKADDAEQQLVAAVQRIEEGLANVWETLTVMVEVLTMEEEAPAAAASSGDRPPDVRAAIGAYLVGSLDERGLRAALDRACEVPVDPRD